jgi:5-methylthioribose kinase
MLPFFLRADDPEALAAYLRGHEWIAQDEIVHAAAPAGDGNMNCTLRVVTSQRQLIVKQGRPWVEKYPDIPAPPDRSLVEAAFYHHIAGIPAVAGRMPTLVGADRESRVLVLADCVGFADLSPVYEGVALGAPVVEALLSYLSALHHQPIGDPAAPPFANPAMRGLNHAYMYALPLVHDAATAERLDQLAPGLSEAAAALTSDDEFATRVAALGHRYLHGAPQALLHGDYFPGSWLVQGRDVVVIDPEFCFAGPPEFDYGVMAAHLMLAGQPAGLLAQVASAARGAGRDLQLVAAFAGAEVMRRLIGVAQLPRLSRPLATKQALLERSRRLVLGLESLTA